VQASTRGVDKVRKWTPSVEAHFIDPPIAELRPTKIASYGGDVLIRQTKRSERWLERSLAGIKLGKIGRLSIVPDVWSHPQTGQARAVRHLCRVALLPGFVPAGEVTLEVSNGTMFVTNTEVGKVKAYYEDYGDRANPGEIVVVGDGEYIQVESSGEGDLTASWTSELSFARLLKKISEDAAFVPVKSDDSTLQIVDDYGDIELAEGTVRDIALLVREEDPNVTYARLNYEGATLIWSCSERRVTWSVEEYFEIALAMPEANFKLLRHLIRHTGSDAVRANSSQLLSRLKQVAAA